MITERGANASEAALGLLPQEIDGPLPYISSRHAGWEGLEAEAFHLPRELESWRIPASPDIILVLYTGGAMHVERRQAGASWQGGVMHHGDLSLHWVGGPSYDARSWSCSALPTQVLNLHLSRELVERVAEEEVGVELARLEVVGRTRFHDPLLEQMAQGLWQELAQSAPAGKLYAQSAAQFLSVHLVRQYALSSRRVTDTLPAPGELTARQLRQVHEFIRWHLSEGLSLEAVAQEIGFSPYHFARLFRRTTGASLHQFVLRQRLEYARWLLRETETPLAQVALACGFADQSHLNLVFQRHLGCTPRAYRQQTCW